MDYPLAGLLGGVCFLLGEVYAWWLFIRRRKK